MPKVITIGEAMGLFAANEPGELAGVSHYTRYSAGAEMNVAIGLARLGCEVFYATQFGDDPIGRYLCAAMEGEGIRSDYICYSSQYTTGLMLKEKAIKGDPAIAYYRAGSAASRYGVEHAKSIDFSGFAYMHLAGIFAALSPSANEASHYFAQEARKNKVKTTFDPNLRPALWPSQDTMVAEINRLAFQCDIVLPGIGEGRILTGREAPEEIARFYLEQGAQAVFVKLGADGAYVADAQGESFYSPGFLVDEIVDTVGAGDGFAVGVISALAEGLSLRQAAQRGNAIGAMQLAVPGDNDGLPGKEALKRFIGHRHA